MFSFLKKTPLDHFSIFLSLTSSSVQGALVRNSHSSASPQATSPEVVLIVTEELKLTRSLDNVAISNLITTTVQDILNELVRNLPKHAAVGSVHVVLSSPWVMTHTKTSLQLFDPPQEINKSTLTKMIELEKDVIRKEYFDAECIEEKICGIKVNGYEVENLVRTQAKSLEVSFIISSTAQPIFRGINGSVATLFPRIKPVYHSGLLLEYFTLNRLYPDIRDCVFIDVHGEITDIISIGAGIPRYTGSFPTGVREFFEKVVKELRVSARVAESTLALHEDEGFSPAATDKVGENIINAGADWIKHMSDAIHEISQVMIVPGKLLVCADEHQPSFVSLTEKVCKEGHSSTTCDIMEYSHDIFGSHISFIPSSRHDGRLAAYVLGVRDLL